MATPNGRVPTPPDFADDTGPDASPVAARRSTRDIAAASDRLTRAPRRPSSVEVPATREEPMPESVDLDTRVGPLPAAPVGRARASSAAPRRAVESEYDADESTQERTLPIRRDELPASRRRAAPPPIAAAEAPVVAQPAPVEPTANARAARRPSILEVSTDAKFRPNLPAAPLSPRSSPPELEPARAREVTPPATAVDMLPLAVDADDGLPFETTDPIGDRLSSVPAPATAPFARRDLREQSTRVGPLPEAPAGRRQTGVEHQATSLLEVGSAIDDFAPRRVEQQATSQLPAIDERLGEDDAPAPRRERLAPPVAELSTSVLPQLDDPVEPPPAQPARRSNSLSSMPARRRRPTHDGIAASGAADKPAPFELSRVFRLEAVAHAGKSRMGFQVAIGVLMLFFGGGILAAVAFHTDKPPLETLQVNYPYGFSGGMMPNGRRAPPVSQVIFDFDGVATCGDGECVKYKAHTADNHFQMTMELRHDGSDWNRVGGP